MAKAKHTSGMGKEHEDYVVSVFEWDNAQRSRSSGAKQHDPVDITSDSMVVECEATEAESYTLKKEFWQEVVSKAHTGKKPALAIRFRDPENGRHKDLLIIELHDGSEVFEEVEAYRTEVLKRNA